MQLLFLLINNLNAQASGGAQGTGGILNMILPFALILVFFTF
jgi:hypothetical protein